MALDLSATATTLLRTLASASEGGNIKLIRITGSVENQDTGVVTPGTAQEIALNGHAKDYDDSAVDGNRIFRGDKLGIFDGRVEPLPTDKVRVTGKDHAIVAISPVAVDGVVQVYRCQLRST